MGRRTTHTSELLDISQASSDKIKSSRGRAEGHITCGKLCRDEKSESALKDFGSSTAYRDLRARGFCFTVYKSIGKCIIHVNFI